MSDALTFNTSETESTTIPIMRVRSAAWISRTMIQVRSVYALESMPNFSRKSTPPPPPPPPLPTGITFPRRLITPLT